MDPKYLLVLLVRCNMQTFGLRLTRRFRDIIERDDVYGAVDLALIRAVRRFDPLRGAFLSFATIWVKREVLKLVRCELRWQQRAVHDAKTLERIPDDFDFDTTEQRDAERVLVGEIDAIWRAHVGDGQSLRDIAANEGLSVRQVQRRIDAAEQALRRIHAITNPSPHRSRRQSSRADRGRGAADHPRTRSSGARTPARGRPTRER